MSPEREVRIGVVGAGDNTRKRHLPGLQALFGVRIVGVCNRSEASSRRVASEFGIRRIYRDWAEAVADPETDAIVVGTWPNLHARVAMAALEAGKHVLCEARMARDAAEARAMLAQAQRRPRLVAQLVPAPFSLGVDATVRRLIAEGYLGDILAIEHHGPASFPDAAGALTWRKDRDLSGFNIAALGIVYEMLMRWVGEAVLVTAMGRVHPRMRRDAEGRLRPATVPDHLDVAAEMACGAQLHLQQSGFTARLLGGGTYLFGTEGALRFHEGTLYGARRADPDWAPIEIPPAERAGWRVEAEFIGAIRGAEPVRLTTFEDGVKYMEFVEAVSRSIAQRRAVNLPLRLDVSGE